MNEDEQLAMFTQSVAWLRAETQAAEAAERAASVFRKRKWRRRLIELEARALQLQREFAQFVARRT
jgi:hypothetical protein